MQETRSIVIRINILVVSSDQQGFNATKTNTSQEINDNKQEGKIVQQTNDGLKKETKCFISWYKSRCERTRNNKIFMLHFVAKTIY